MSPDLLREGAILIADAHCAPWREPFLDFLRALESGTIQTPQLILMGDIFDMLYGPIERTYRYNTEALALLNRLSSRIEIFYLEGNHDFLLSRVMHGVRVIPRQHQPLLLRYGERTISLSHGDREMGIGYEIYTLLIRNPFLLGILRTLDNLGSGFIVRWLEKQMKRKNHCKAIEHFDALVRKRLERLHHDGIDIVIEGHFHQNKSFDYPALRYINLAAFACNERYFTVQSTQNKTLLHEAVFRKEPR